MDDGSCMVNALLSSLERTPHCHPHYAVPCFRDRHSSYSTNPKERASASCARSCHILHWLHMDGTTWQHTHACCAWPWTWHAPVRKHASICTFVDGRSGAAPTPRHRTTTLQQLTMTGRAPSSLRAARTQPHQTIEESAAISQFVSNAVRIPLPYLPVSGRALTSWCVSVRACEQLTTGAASTLGAWIPMRSTTIPRPRVAGFASASGQAALIPRQRITSDSRTATMAAVCMQGALTPRDLTITPVRQWPALA